MRKNGMKYRSGGIPKNYRASRAEGAGGLVRAAAGRSARHRRPLLRLAGPMIPARDAEPVVDHYPLAVRVVIFGGLAAAAWGGVMGGIDLISAAVRHWG